MVGAMLGKLIETQIETLQVLLSISLNACNFHSHNSRSAYSTLHTMDPSTTIHESTNAQTPAREDLLKQHSYSILKSHMAVALEDSAIDTCLQVNLFVALCLSLAQSCADFLCKARASTTTSS